MKKSNAGITLISLVITIIILLILASIGINSGINTIKSSGMTKFTTEMKIMQLKVNELYDSYTNNKSITVDGTEYTGKGKESTEGVEAKPGIQTIGKDLSSAPQDKLSEASSGSGFDITDENGYRYYDQDIIKALKIDGVDGGFFINVANRKVISAEGYEYEGQKYYTLEQLPDGLYNVEYNKVDGNLNFETSSEVIKGKGKIHIVNISYDQYVNKWQLRYRLKAEEGQEENAWTTTEDFVGSGYTIDVPIENLLKEYEIQVIHGDEIASAIKVAHVLQVGDYINYDPTNGGTITTTYTSPQGTYHADRTAVIADTSPNMIEGNGYANQTFSVSANTNGWRVLGVDEEKNEIMLISADIVTTESTDNGYFYLRGQTGYEWGIKELNDICAIYGQGKGANGARSITIADINKITGYNPETAQCYDGEIYEYGNEVTYTKSESNISYQDSLNNKSGIYGDSSTIFKYYDEENSIWKALTTGESKKLKSTAYHYYPNTLTTNSSGDTVGISTDSAEYEMLVSRTSNGQNYWIATPYTYADSGVAYFGLRRAINGYTGGDHLFYSDGGINPTSYGVRPVVSLKSNVNISGEGGTSISTAYQIQ